TAVSTVVGNRRGWGRCRPRAARISRGALTSLPPARTGLLGSGTKSAEATDSARFSAGVLVGSGMQGRRTNTQSTRKGLAAGLVEIIGELAFRASANRTSRLRAEEAEAVPQATNRNSSRGAGSLSFRNISSGR